MFGDFFSVNEHWEVRVKDCYDIQDFPIAITTNYEYALHIVNALTTTKKAKDIPSQIKGGKPFSAEYYISHCKSENIC
jgi:hypothetical protein